MKAMMEENEQNSQETRPVIIFSFTMTEPLTMFLNNICSPLIPLSLSTIGCPLQELNHHYRQRYTGSHQRASGLHETYRFYGEIHQTIGKN